MTGVLDGKDPVRNFAFPWRFLALPCALAVGVIGCSSSSKSSTRSTASVPPSTTLATTTTTSVPSAAGDLEHYFAAAAAVDARLKDAAAAINGAIGKTTVTVDQSTLDAIEAANPVAAAKEIPSGLTPSLLLPVLTVQSDLVSRYFSLRGFRLNLANPGQPRTFSVSDPNVGYARACLGEGASAAGSFAADLAAGACRGRRGAARRRGRRPARGSGRSRGPPTKHSAVVPANAGTHTALSHR